MRVLAVLGICLFTLLHFGCASTTPREERSIASGSAASVSSLRTNAAKAPQVICSAHEYSGNAQTDGVRHQRLNLSTKTDTGFFASLTVLETPTLKFIAKGSVNSEDAMSLSIVSKKTGHDLAASSGAKKVSLSIGDQRDNRLQAWVDCWEESLLRQHYLNGICNVDGTVARKDIPSYDLERVTTDCKQLKEIGVF